MQNHEKYSYVLPENSIASCPAEPRDSCKLLVYKTATDEFFIDRFSELHEYLPDRSFLVMNDTHVAPVRLYCSSDTKKRIEVFILINELKPGDSLVRAMVDRKIIPGQTIYVIEVAKHERQKKFSFEVISQDRQYFMLKPNFPISQLTTILNEFGTTPIPKYIRETPLTENELREKYQTVFTAPGSHKFTTHSAAAPTASLHFTNDLLHKLDARGIDQLMVTLHVGLGTFAPISAENFETKKLFNEYYEVSEQTSRALTECKNDGRPLVAVGTTAVRTLESFARTNEYANKSPISSGTEIFIFPPFEFKLVDCLITNFHLPNSSLMMLVDALLQNKKAKKSIKEIYEFALQNEFKFYSFGDAMMIV